MYAMRSPVFPQGTRVRLKQGRFPLPAALLGREGLVVFMDDYRPGRYGVVLDGETERHEFGEDELERVSAPVS